MMLNTSLIIIVHSKIIFFFYWKNLKKKLWQPIISESDVPKVICTKRWIDGRDKSKIIAVDIYSKFSREGKLIFIYPILVTQFFHSKITINVLERYTFLCISDITEYF